MAIRIEKKSISVTPTQDPSVFLIEADVTKDGPEITTPAMERVSVLWNTNTPKSAIKDAMRAKMKDKTVLDDIKNAIGEDVVTNGGV